MRVRRLAILVAISALTVSVGVTGPTDAMAGEPPPPCLLAPVHAPVRDPFRSPACPWCPGNRGIEYATAPGGPARAGAAGVVAFAGPVAGTLYVVVDHPSGLRTTYGRLATIGVAVGQGVAAATVVGTTGAQFFFGVRRSGTYLDPAAFLVELRRRPRLVPTAGGPRRPDHSARLSCRIRHAVLGAP